jgi:ribosome biogenesis GTPase
LSTIDTNTNDRGVVYKKSTGSYRVRCGERMLTCNLSSRLHKELIYPTAAAASLQQRVQQVREISHVDPVVIGDRVRLVCAPDGSGLPSGTGMIVEVLPRRNRLARPTAAPMPGAHTFEQVIVANLDQVLPVFAAANPTPKWNMLDRYLVAAAALDLPARVCITKSDLVQEDEELTAEVETYRRAGFHVILTSTVTGEGLDELRATLNGCVSVMVGKSGVGKTSLLNALQPGLGLRVSVVNQVTGKGRHTTSYLEMFPLETGGAIVDTPGTREFGLWDVPGDELASFFPEMRPYVGKCRFGLDCAHDEEPGCALRRAVVNGQISPRRYQSYLRLYAEAK